MEGLKNNSVVLTHNHPMSTSFSDDDIALLLDCPQIKTIIAGGHNGTVYKLSIGNRKRVEYKDIILEYYQLYNDVKDSDKTLLALSTKYKWNYEVIKNEEER